MPHSSNLNGEFTGSPEALSTKSKQYSAAEMDPGKRRMEYSVPGIGLMWMYLLTSFGGGFTYSKITHEDVNTTLRHGTHPSWLDDPVQRLCSTLLALLEPEALDVSDVLLVQLGVYFLRCSLDPSLGQVEQLPVVAWLDPRVVCLDVFNAEIAKEDPAGGRGGFR